MRHAVNTLLDHLITMTLQILSAVVFIDNEKQTVEVAKELQYYIDKRRARKFYDNEGLMPHPYIFNHSVASTLGLTRVLASGVLSLVCDAVLRVLWHWTNDF